MDKYIVPRGGGEDRRPLGKGGNLARPQKQTADYFPHYVNHGKTLLILENEFGNVGYAFWFKLLELLCQSDGQFYDYGNPAAWRLLLAKTNTAEETADKILSILTEVGAVDGLLIQSKVIWVQNLVDNLALMYSRREGGVPQKPVIANGNVELPSVLVNNNVVSVNNNPHTKLNNTKLNNTKLGGNGFQDYLKMLQTIRYPTLDIQALWEDCQGWYTDHGKQFTDAKRALNNWCKRELAMHQPQKPRGQKGLPSTKELKEGWDQ